MPLSKLRNYLAAVSPGKIPAEQADEVESLLSSCWDRIEGSTDGGMAAYKLDFRAEQMEWEPPTLSFRIERHGGAFRGSSRGELQNWSVDVERESAALGAIGHRQLRPSAPRLDVKPLASEIAELIMAQRNDHRLKWKSASDVKVELTKIIPNSGPRATVPGRRKRFRDELKRLLEPAGWMSNNVGTHLVFQRLDAAPGADGTGEKT